MTIFNERTPFKHLKLNKLNSVLKNISLGKDHLSNILTPNEMRQLLKQADLKQQQKNNIKSNKKEKSGRAALVVNTIITGCLGGWLGISAYSHIKLNNIMTVIIIVAAFILGSLIAILNFYLTTKKAREVLDKGKILAIELSLTNLIIKKRKKLIKKIEDKITKIINLDKQSADIVQDVKVFVLNNNLNKFRNININSEVNVDSVMNYIKKIITKLENIQKDHKLSDDIYTHNPAYVNKLITKKEKKIKTTPLTIGYWMKNNISGILMNLMPTLLGGFASMFVFIDGIPTIMTYYEINLNLGESSVLYLKIFGLILAISLTSYYGYSQVYSDYKDYFRIKQLEITEYHIAEKYNVIIKQLVFLRLLTRLKYYLNLLKLFSSLST